MASDFSFSNILLASMNGQVIMSAAQDKTSSFLGRSLTQGALKESALAKCFNKALNSDGMHFADFQIYSTSGNVHSFLCQKALAEFDHEDDGIYVGDTLGVVITELNLETLNAITQQRTGMGETGQVYLVGEDSMLRSNPILNTKKYNLKSSLQGKVLLKTETVKEAHAGKTGTREILGPNGEQVLSVFGPLAIYGKKWAFVAEKNLDEIYAPISSMIFFMAALSAILFIVIIGVGSVSSKMISGPIALANRKLKGVSGNVSEDSIQIKDYSSQLSNYSTELSSSVHETVTTMDELTQMVNKNLESVERSSEMAGQSQEAANSGIDKVESMLGAIQDIHQTNESVATEVSGMNNEMQEIINVIKEIGAKTSVINDIVFQTKLLSFNASVEAARAGEHGKGFAVVAEEVGNLATESGRAANEIGSMLNDSISKVEDIISSSKVKMDQVSTLGKEKVQIGLQVAEDCKRTLEDIAENVSEVNQLVQEVAVASNEQASGIQEISGAMQQLDHICNESQNIAQSILKVSDDLSNGSKDLYEVVGGLGDLVYGERRKSENDKSAQDKTGTKEATSKKAPLKLVPHDHEKKAS